MEAMEMEAQVPPSKRRPITALLSYYLILFLCFLCTCQANSISNVDGHHGLTKNTGNNDIIVGNNVGEKDVIQSIVSQLSSWMKEKRKNAKHAQDIEEEDLLLLQQQQQPQKHQLALPFVTLAYAQTLDGMIAAQTQSSPTREEKTTTSNMQLSSPPSMTLTHHLRSMHDAILVGGSTFLLDAPRLNVRLPSSSIESSISSSAAQHATIMDQPMPIVLDTHLNHLQRLLFDKIVSTALSSSSQSAQSSKEEILPDITIEKIRAHHPIICCSANAARSFLDILEVFQDQQTTKRKRKKSYKITVYKKIDDENDHERDIYLPIKITIHITHHKKHEEDVSQDVTLTLLPCPIHERRTNSLDIEQVLHQLYNQFGIESVMVEGGAGILSSFLNACVDDNAGGSEDGGGGSSKRRRYNKVVDCICATIVPKVIGGKWGLPVLGGLDVLPDGHGDKHSVKGSDGDDGSDGSGGGGSDDEMLPMMAIKDGEFVSLGPDCIFLGRV